MIVRRPAGAVAGMLMDVEFVVEFAERLVASDADAVVDIESLYG